MAAEIKRCREPFAIEVDGITRVIAAGDLVSTDDAIYSKATREHFESVAAHVTQQAGRRAAAAGSGVEAATAAPGEVRDLTPPAPVTQAFDPGEHGVPEVLAYLAEADAEERERVLAAEAAGKKRATIAKAATGGDAPAE